MMIIGAIVFCAVLYYLFQRKKPPVKKISHEYFSRVWLWLPDSHTRWEAELDVSKRGVNEQVGFHSETTHAEVAFEEPTEKEIAFCKSRMANLDELFELTRPAVEEAWEEWVGKKMPRDWRNVLSLDGLSAPKDGDITKPWSVTYFCEPAGHFFCIDIRGGKATLSSVDG